MATTLPNGAIKTTGTITPTSVTDTYGTHIDEFGVGGWMAVNTLEDRDNIPAERRKAGMAVSVNENNTVYKLGVDLTNDDWFEFGGSGGGNGNAGTGGVSLPEGGKAGQYLVKRSSANGDAVWREMHIATITSPGVVQPDNETIDIDADGKIVVNPEKLNMPLATVAKHGVVSIDNNTIKMDEQGRIYIPADKIKDDLVDMDDIDVTDMDAKSGYFLAVNEEGTGFCLKQGNSVENKAHKFEVDNENEFKLIYNLGPHMNSAVSAYIECKSEGDLELMYVSNVGGGDVTEVVDNVLVRYIPSREFNIRIYAKGKGVILIDILSFMG